MTYWLPNQEPLSGQFREASTLVRVEDISRHKGAFRDRQRSLRDLLCEWDPVGVSPNDGGPRDECDCLLGMIGELRGGLSEADLGRYLEDELRDHFGLDPEYARPMDFAHRVFEWYWRDPLPGSVEPQGG